MRAEFCRFADSDYQGVCDFLIALNAENKTHINWNWARWEWMYHHPYFERNLRNRIGLWKAEGNIVGAAIYDLYFGEAFCAALESHRTLLPEIFRYAYDVLKDENGLGIAVQDGDVQTQDLLSALGYHAAEQTETMLCRSLKEELSYTLPDGYRIREIAFPADHLAYQTVIWKGFDHENDPDELARMLANDVPVWSHYQPFLCLAVQDVRGEFAAHCTCWYDGSTDYAYVEPVCTVPAHRRKGLGAAVVSEALNRCRHLGAKEAFVISDQPFYFRLGFCPYAHYTFYWKP